MTLVVAAKIPDSCYPGKQKIIILGDTRLSSKDKSKKSYKQGAIKTNIIHDNLAISWAGNSQHADDFFKTYTSSLSTMGKNEIIECVFAFYKERKRETDFILCFGNSENQDLEIISIKNGEVGLDCSFAWVGSQTAYNRFNEYRIKNIDQYKSDTSQDPIFLDNFFMLAMREVIAEQLDPLVGDFFIQVLYCHQKYFLYLSFYDHIDAKRSKNKWFSPGDPSDGAYSIAIVRDQRIRNIVAVYIYQSNQGLVFKSPEKGGIMKCIESVFYTPSEFTDFLKKYYKVQVLIHSY